MVVNFKVREISRGARKLTRTPTLNKKQKTKNKRMVGHILRYINCSIDMVLHFTFPALHLIFMPFEMEMVQAILP